MAYTFAEAGVKGILLADINSEGIVKAAEETTTLASNPDYHCFSSTVDVTDPASVEAMVNLAVDRFGCIDYCINAFGVRPHGNRNSKPHMTHAPMHACIHTYTHTLRYKYTHIPWG